MFAIFDFVRDGHAFVKCESVCRAFCGLLQSPTGIGRKLWEARPILYDEDILNDHVVDGDRRVLLEFIAFESYDEDDGERILVREDSVVLKFVGPTLWTRIVEDLHARCRPDNSHLPRLELSDLFVKALTETVEWRVQRLIKGALMCSAHRGSSTLTAADIELARALTQDKTMRQECRVRWSRTFGSPDGLSPRSPPAVGASLPTRCPSFPLRRRIASSARSCAVTVVSLTTGEPTSCCGF